MSTAGLIVLRVPLVLADARPGRFGLQRGGVRWQCLRRLFASGVASCVLLLSTLASAVFISTPALAASQQYKPCVEKAAKYYRLPPVLIYAVIEQESSGRATAINSNSNGSYDMGLMQINSSWLPKFKKHGLTEEHVWMPCVNIMLGSWIMAPEFIE